jgi:hypothetical protein
MTFKVNSKALGGVREIQICIEGNNASVFGDEAALSLIFGSSKPFAVHGNECTLRKILAGALMAAVYEGVIEVMSPTPDRLSRC